MSNFSRKLLRWYDHSGRKDLPWQTGRSPYRVWISEIMLQQTQVSTVVPFFERFMSAFPDVHSLAAAPLDKVLHRWTGLGYYARARNLHKAAKIVSSQHGGVLPRTVAELEQLPGIGRSTAGAIIALSMNQPAAILDGNVKRVLARVHAIQDWPGRSAVKDRLWQIAESLLPKNRHADYAQALMDLGATLCTRSKPDCACCPVRVGCRARAEDLIEACPGRKPRAVVPVRQITLHILQNDRGEILLQRRDASGIWGGLWSFPESPADKPVPTSLSRQFRTVSRNPLPTFRHTFSHFHLDIRPVLRRVVPRTNGVRDDHGLQWVSLRRPPMVGLAAPVKKLLAQLADSARRR